MNWLTALILGIVQGLTELLPVSSSGHLVLFEKLMGVHLKDVSFEISVHIATAAALCVVLRREIWLMLRSLVPYGAARSGSEGVGAVGAGGTAASVLADEKRKGRTLLLAVIVGSIPAALLGLAFSDKIEAAFHGVSLTLAMLPLTGIFLIATRWARDGKRALGVGRGLAVGVAQAVAILPGISRSGMTVGAGLLLGVGREEAVRFSFLLSLPAIAGAALFKFLKGAGAASGKAAALAGGVGAGATVAAGGQTVSGGAQLAGLTGVSAQNLAIAGVVAFLSALLAARLLLGVVRRGKLEYFGYYCLLVGGLGLVLLAR